MADVLLVMGGCANDVPQVELDNWIDESRFLLANCNMDVKRVIIDSNEFVLMNNLGLNEFLLNGLVVGLYSGVVFGDTFDYSEAVAFGHAVDMIHAYGGNVFVIDEGEVVCMEGDYNTIDLSKDIDVVSVRESSSDNEFIYKLL